MKDHRESNHDPFDLPKEISSLQWSEGVTKPPWSSNRLKEIWVFWKLLGISFLRADGETYTKYEKNF